MASLFDKARAKLGLYEKSSGYYPELTTSAGPESTGAGNAPRENAAETARKKSKKRRKKREKEKARLAAIEAAKKAAEEAETEEAAEESEPEADLIESVADVTTSEGSAIGTTSVTPAAIYTKPVEEAVSDQEKLAQEELRRKRIKRARTKQSLLRRRLERSQDLGAGKRVLSGSERNLNIQSRQAGSGTRSGEGRRSLITGSGGGIGYYSRFL